MVWKVGFYTTASGQEPVKKFIRSLQSQTRAKLIHLIDLLEENGPTLGLPHAKPIGKGLFELRLRGKEETRSLYIFQNKDEIIILHAFKKKTMAIRKSDLDIATARKSELGQ